MIPPKPPAKQSSSRDYLPENFKKVIDLLGNLLDNKFYGKLEIKFEAGNIVLCKKEENLKL